MKPKRTPTQPTTYTLVHELMASPVHAAPLDHQRYQVAVMRAGLAAIERADNPTPTDWRLVSDAVNLMETLITCGPWMTVDGALADVQDERGLLQDAVAAMAIAGARHLQTGQPIRLTGAGMLAVRGLLDDYAEVIAAITHRAMIQAHRKTERRIREIWAGKRQAHDVEVVAV